MQAATILDHSIAPTYAPERPYESASLSGPETAETPLFSNILNQLLGKKDEAPSKIEAKEQAAPQNRSKGEKTPTASSAAAPTRTPLVAKSVAAKNSGTVGLQRSDSTARKGAANSVAEAVNGAISKVLTHSAETTPVVASKNVSTKKTEASADSSNGRTKNRGDKVEEGSDSGIILAAVSTNGQNLSVKPKEPTEGADPKERETRGSERVSGKRETKVSVVDLRMKPESKDSGSTQGTKPVEGQENSREGAFAPGHTTDGSVPFEKTESPSPPSGPSFSDILSRHLADSGSQDIVKAAQIVLRDGDSGIIRLRLEPESLGNVKIELKMTEKNITGKIVVETNEARSAFEKNMAGLKDAFSAGGFETANLEVSVNGGETGGGGNARQDESGPFFTERLKELNAAVPMAATATVRADNGVNILA